MDSSNDDSGESKGGQQLGRENVAKVKAYVERIRQDGKRLPSNKGRPYWQKITSDLEFGRGVWRDNPAARDVIEKAALDPEVGIAASANTNKENGEAGASAIPAFNEKEAYTQKQLDDKDRENNRLRERLAVQDVELDALRRKVTTLEDALRKYEIFEDVMVNSGRRFIP